VPKYESHESDLPPLVNFLNLPPRPRPEAPGGPPGAIVCVLCGGLENLREIGLKVLLRNRSGASVWRNDAGEVS